MIKGVDQIAIAVKDLEQAKRFYGEVLGLPMVHTEVLEEERVKVALFKVGQVEIELLEGIGEENPVAKFLAKRGEGLHHISLEVEDLEGTLVRLEKAGVPLIDKVPRKGASGTMVAFLHPQGCHGVLIELVEKRAG
ncbi:MAG: methylmalonyl-CoA epimerase [candidate division NC10 bacterium]|nr:methylmalonyl-CoA epimerase [candidate division NC10 bacterium]